MAPEFPVEVLLRQWMNWWKSSLIFIYLFIFFPAPLPVRCSVAWNDLGMASGYSFPRPVWESDVVQQPPCPEAPHSYYCTTSSLASSAKKKKKTQTNVRLTTSTAPSNDCFCTMGRINFDCVKEMRLLSEGQQAEVIRWTARRLLMGHWLVCLNCRVYSSPPLSLITFFHWELAA